jgi:hypothetical protein
MRHEKKHSCSSLELTTARNHSATLAQRAGFSATSAIYPHKKIFTKIYISIGYKINFTNFTISQISESANIRNSDNEALVQYAAVQMQD